MRLAEFTVSHGAFKVAVPPTQYMLREGEDGAVRLCTVSSDKSGWAIEGSFEKSCVEMNDALSHTTCTACGSYLSLCDRCAGR